MICFEILLNGERFCLAGVESGVLSADVISWQGGSATDREPQLHLHVAGSSNQKRLRWTEPGQTALKVGDEVTIRIVEADMPDEMLRNNTETTQ